MSVTRCLSYPDTLWAFFPLFNTLGILVRPEDESLFNSRYMYSSLNLSEYRKDSTPLSLVVNTSDSIDPQDPVNTFFTRSLDVYPKTF